MTVIDKIHNRVLILPESLQVQVLDFVEFLLAKGETKLKANNHDTVNLEWENLSIAMAMRGMEDEEEPAYTVADLKEKF